MKSIETSVLKVRPLNVTLSPFTSEKAKVVEEDRIGYFWGKGSQDISSSHHNVPHVTYSCNRCGDSGHWIDDCPMGKRQKVVKDYTDKERILF